MSELFVGAAPRLRCFDLDGCVVESDRAIMDGLGYAVGLVGLPMPDVPRMRAAIGPPLISTFVDLAREAGIDPESKEGDELVATAVAAYRVRYEEFGFDLTRPVPGIVPLLERLHATWGTTVIVTAKPTAVAVALLEHIGLRVYFDAVHGVSMGPFVEEKRITLARAIGGSSIAPADAVMIGDRAHDVIAGRACGTRTFGVLWGSGDREELVGAGADLVLSHPQDLVPLLFRA